MSTTDSQSGKLERRLGFGAALSLGVGTMVGAGIFVFPGIAAGYAGPAAMLSFALGGCIALMVAASTAELATAMPESGGGYYFISRTFGPILGTVVGIAQWLGLIFASAFYLIGFGEYANDLLMEFGVSLGDPVVILALVTAVILTMVNISGTETAGDLQNQIVLALSGLLGLLLGYGVLKATGIIGDSSLPQRFTPEGIFPIFTTTALIFTSYLGFVQIATVAGEIREPYKNLPRALMGSVIVVTLLYVLALFVATSTLPVERLGELGETAMIQVAESLIGRLGAMIVLGAGLLATLSSANASILSSSRAIFALSKDSMIPSAISKVNQKFGTPHLALLSVGVPIALLTLIQSLETLAEVASLFHLIIYGLICISLIVLRKKEPIWYAPTYRVPYGLAVAITGVILCFGLIGFMSVTSIMIGFSLIAAAGVWYFSYARSKELEPPKPSHIVPSLRSPRVLLPVEIPDAPVPPVALFRAFYRLKLFVLGYQVIPEQTSPDQAREHAEDEVENSFQNYVENISKSGIDAEKELVFTSNYSGTLSQYVNEKKFHALLTPKPMESLERLLLPIYKDDQINARVATILRELAAASELPISILFLDEVEESESSEHRLKVLESKARRQFLRSGINEGQIRTQSVNVDNIVEAVDQIASSDDLVIIPESKETDRERLFQNIHNEIQQKLDCPTLVIFQETDESGTDQQKQEKAEEITS
ncbi:MAG: APC family permease [Balneolaceae bacterium]|nr:APC family permease [Balneolaceae bacterium]